MARYPSLSSFSGSLVSRSLNLQLRGTCHVSFARGEQRLFSRLSLKLSVTRAVTGNVWSGQGLSCRTGSAFLACQRRFVSGNQRSDKDDKSLASATKKAISHENIYTIPNILTASRLVVAPIIGYCILNGDHNLALSLFTYAAVTDLVDGYIARKWNQQTVVGTVIDPMADKFLMTIGVVCLAMKAAIPMWLAGLILARDVGLAFAAIYYRWISLPPPKTMTRYWDFSLPSAEVKPTEVSKVNTALQLALLGSAMAMPVLPEAMMTAWYLQEGMVGL
ncbi:hypothetical protein FQN49_008456, partial [Arthroderma sp. PD_2]